MSGARSLSPLELRHAPCSSRAQHPRARRRLRLTPRVPLRPGSARPGNRRWPPGAGRSGQAPRYARHRRRRKRRRDGRGLAPSGAPSGAECAVRGGGRRAPAVSPARPRGIAHRQLSVGVAAARDPRPRGRRARGDRAVARSGRGRKVARVRGTAGRRACGRSARRARNRICPPRSDPRGSSRGDAGRGGRVRVVVGQAPAGGDGATGDAATTTCLVEAETLGGARKLQPPGLASGSRPDVPIAR